MRKRTTLLCGNKYLSFDIMEMPYTPLLGECLYILGKKISKDSLEVVDFGLSSNLPRYLGNNKDMHFDLLLTCYLPSFREGLIHLGKIGLKKGKTLVFDIESRLEDMRRDVQ